VSGQLFTQDFLSAGIADTPAWKSVTDAELDAFVAQIKTVYAPFKVLSRLGWTDILTQQVASKSRREDVPDMLLFPNAAAKSAALKVGRRRPPPSHGATRCPLLPSLRISLPS
jgi:hypothetical protein